MTVPLLVLIGIGLNVVLGDEVYRGELVVFRKGIMYIWTKILDRGYTHL